MSVNGNPATGAQTSLFFVEEETCNVVPTSPVWNPLRFTGGIPALSREQLQSAELDGTREINGQRSGSRSAAGEINVELSHLSHAELIAAALQSEAVVQPIINETESTISFNATTSTISDSNSSNNHFQGVRPGRKITVSGSASNNGVFTVVTATNNSVVVEEDLTTTSAGASVSLDAPAVNSVSVGGTVKTYSLMVRYGDLGSSNSYDIITGVEFTGFAVNLAVNAIATATFSVIGRDYNEDAALPSGSTFNDATTTRPYTGLDGAIVLDGTPLGVVTSMTPTLDNNANPEFAIGSAGVSYVSYGRANNTFDLATAFTSYDLFSRFISEQESAIRLRLELDGNFLEFVYPRTQIVSGAPNPEGEGTIALPVSVQALRDAGVGSSIVISYNS